jgi:dipeptide/tripeptide permease
MSKKNILTTVGFLLFIIGGSTVILSLVGVQLAPFVWLDVFGNSVGFVLKLTCMLAGIIIAALGSAGFDGDDEKDQYARRNEKY